MSHSRSEGAPDQSLLHVGWREWVCLPDLLAKPLRAKMDSGARSSALAVRHIRLRNDEVRFRVVGQTQGRRAPLQDERWVTDAGGHRELRPVICTTLQLGAYRTEIEITLTARRGLRYRMLVGRSALAGHCLVDPSSSYLLARP